MHLEVNVIRLGVSNHFLIYSRDPSVLGDGQGMVRGLECSEYGTSLKAIENSNVTVNKNAATC